MKAYARILTAVYAEVWAIQPEKLDAITGFLELKAEGRLPDANVVSEIHSAAVLTAARARNASQTGKDGAVAVLPLYGLIMQRGNMVGDISGPRGTSVEQFKQQFRQALNDPGIKAIVIDVDSPGGTVSGVDELTSEIFKARGRKPVIAVANCLMASAAYYIASAASEIVASPSALIGSIGVYAALRDESGALEKAGIKVHLVTYGENKAEGDPRVPTSDSAIANLQKIVTAAGMMFDTAVARGRGVTSAKVRDAYGQGMVFSAADARRVGLIDRVASLDDVLAGLGVDASAAVRSPMQGKAAGLRADSSTLDGLPCECTCGPCEEGTCDGCTVEDCGNEGCMCDSAVSKRKGQAQTALHRAAVRRQAMIAAA